MPGYRVLSILCLVLAPACAGKPLPPLTPDLVARSGDTTHYGPGMTALSADGRRVSVELAASARAFFFNVHRNGWVEQLDTRLLSSGRATFSIPLTILDRPVPPTDPFVPARSSSLDNQRVVETNPAAVRREMLLLVVCESSVDPTRREFDTFNQFTIPSGSQAEVVVPALMFRERPVRWAAYLVR